MMQVLHMSSITSSSAGVELDAKACMEKAVNELGLEGLQSLLRMFLQRTKEGEECSICLSPGVS